MTVIEPISVADTAARLTEALIQCYHAISHRADQKLFLILSNVTIQSVTMLLTRNCIITLGDVFTVADTAARLTEALIQCYHAISDIADQKLFLILSNVTIQSVTLLLTRNCIIPMLPYNQ